MEFKAKIYAKDTTIPFYKRWTLSQFLFYVNVIIAILLLFISVFFGLRNPIFIKIISFVVFAAPVTLAFSLIYRFFEFEKVNGKIDGQISFENFGVKINNKLFLFTEMRSFRISYGDKINDKKINNIYKELSLLPYNSSGLNNYISFRINEKRYLTNFQIIDSSQIDAIQSDLFHYVIKEVFPFKKKNLDFIDEKYHNHTLYKEFIEKMKREGKLT
jgi:hypothetical protein